MTEDYFIKQLNETFDELNNALIKSFINIFGEKNKYKIINRINNLNLVLFAPNLSLSVIEESLNYYDDVISKIKGNIEIIIDSNGNKYVDKSKLKEDEYLVLNELCYQYNYALNMKRNKKNNTDDSIFMYMRSPNYNQNFQKCIDEISKDSLGADGLSNFDFKYGHINIMLRKKDDNRINMENYIHEIIHGLMYESLLVVDDKTITIDGVIKEISNYEIVNEIFVDYLSLVIALDVVRNKRLNNFIVNMMIVESLYINVDSLCGSFLEETFFKLKDIIIDEILNAGNSKIKKIIGIDTLKKIENYLDMITTKLFTFNEDMTLKDMFSEEEIHDMKKFGENIYEEIEKNYNKYLETTKSEDEYVTKLEEQGIVRRV